MQVLTPDMIGRIASALGPGIGNAGQRAVASAKVALLALTTIGAVGSPGFAQTIFRSIPDFEHTPAGALSSASARWRPPRSPLHLAGMAPIPVGAIHFVQRSVHEARMPKQFRRSVPRFCVSVRGRDTSVTVDPPFWDALREIATERCQSVSNLLTSIDANRQQSNFSSAIRVFVLRHYTDRLAARRLHTAPEAAQAEAV
jgi:predicted DNA-binding ribbon-helix-helix protein